MSIANILRDLPFFEGFDERYVEIIAGCAANARFEPGTYIFHEGDDAGLLYLIRSGCVALEMSVPTREPLEIQALGPGDLLGWSWIVAPYQWRFDAHAIEETQAFVFDGACLRRKCEENTDLGYALLKRITVTLGQRLDATRMQLIDIYGVPI